MNKVDADRLAIELEAVSNCAVDVNPESPENGFIVIGDFYLADIIQATYRIGYTDGINSESGKFDDEYPSLVIDKTEDGYTIK